MRIRAVCSSVQTEDRDPAILHATQKKFEAMKPNSASNFQTLVTHHLARRLEPS